MFAALLAVTASAQTPPAADAPKKEEAAGLTVKLGADTVTVYGLIDATIGTQDNMNATGGRQTGFRTAWFSGNRWGIQAKHPVSTDLSVIAKLESEYTVANGAMDTPNVIFNRDAWVGFESSLIGQITFGRQNTMSRDFAQNYGDAYGSAAVRMDEGGWTNTNNFKHMIYYAAGANGGTRLDNSVVLKKKLGDFIVGAGYAMGNQTDNFAKNGTGALGLAWNGGPFNVSGYFTQANVVSSSAAITSKVHRAFSIGGNAQLIPLVRVNVGFFHYTAEQNAALGSRSDNAFTVSTKITPTAEYDFELGYQSMMAKNAAQSGTGAAANTLNAFKDASTATVKGDGNRNAFYASAFYHLSKRAEVYLAGDYLMLTGDYKFAAASGKTNQTELVAGLRFKF
jgi:predicted porin